MRTSFPSSISASEPAFDPRSATAVEGRPVWSQHPPHPAIAAHVSAYWTVELRGPRHVIRTLPHACVDLTLDLTGPVRAHVAGPQKKPRARQLRGHVHLLGARLFPGAAPLLGIDVQKLSDDWSPLDRFCGARDVRRLVDSVSRAEGLAARIGAFDLFLIDRFLNRQIDPRLSRALRRCFAEQGALSVATLARAIAVDARTLGRLFRRWVGLSPKRFARIVRCQVALRDLGAGNGAALAAQLGYFDQAHLIREFKELFGGTPTDARGFSSLLRPEP